MEGGGGPGLGGGGQGKGGGHEGTFISFPGGNCTFKLTSKNTLFFKNTITVVSAS